MVIDDNGCEPGENPPAFTFRNVARIMAEHRIACAVHPLKDGRLLVELLDTEDDRVYFRSWTDVRNWLGY